MTKTVIGSRELSYDEYAIAAMLSTESVTSIRVIQDQLKSLLGNVIWTPPPHVLHSTLMEIICPTEYTGVSRRERFEQWHAKYGEVTRETVARFQPFNMHFSQLLASGGAIIIKAANPQPFNDIRAALLENTVLPVGTKQPPDIIHCSIARYSQAVDLDEVITKTQGLLVDIHEHVSEFNLMKELGPPFHPTTLETYRLA